MHAGASAALSEAERCVIGSDTICNITLADEGVMPIHCVLYWQDGRLKCDAIQGAVRNGPERAGPGESLRVRTGVPLQCGVTQVLVESLDAACVGEADPLTGADSLAGGRRRFSVPLFSGATSIDVSRKFRLFALGAFLALGLSGVAVAIANWSDDAQTDPHLLGDVQAWLRTVSPPGSELRAIYDREARRFAIAGYVPTDYQGELLKRSLRESTYFPRADFISAEGMIGSFVRLVQMEKLMCVAEYAGNGHLKCSNPVATQEHATRMRMLARQVPGVTEVDLQLAPAVPPTPAPAIAAVPAVSTAAATPESSVVPRWDGPQLKGKLSVWILKKDRFVLDWRGIKYRRGDVIDGMTVDKITVDEVDLSRDGNLYSVIVASQ